MDESLLKDERFAHIRKDPKFRRIPKSERKVKIDKRFKSMFKDKKFAVKFTIDKRGRPINQSSSENLKKYYDLSSSEDELSDEEEQSNDTKNINTSKQFKINGNKVDNSIIEKQETDSGDSDTSESDNNFSSNGSLLLVKKQADYDSGENSETESDEIELTENERQLKKLEKSEKKALSSDIKNKLKDLTVDYARGEGYLVSDSSSDESSEYEEDSDNEFDHNWGELDKEAETTDEVTHRLAACNMDWDRIRAIDLMVLFNSFLPVGGLINNVSIYPSEFGLKRMKEEEIRGPIELVETKTQNPEEAVEESHLNDNDDEEGSSYHMEKLRQYQLNRLKYYYAVITFDSSNTANKVYTECDGLEYESSATKLDLRFIPNDMTFDQEPKEVCDQLPELTKYQPRQFTTTALQQVKVDLTWDETNPERLELTQKLNSGKLDEISKDDIQAYLASGTSDDDSEDEVKNVIEKNINSGKDANPIEKYKSLLKSIEQAEEEKKNKEVELEFSWGLGDKEKSEKLVKEKITKNKNLTPFEEYIEKRKEKKKAKRDSKKKNDALVSDSEDSVPSDVDMNDPYFAKEMNKNHKNKNKLKNKKDAEDLSDQDEQKKAELELLLMDKNDENKSHFNMKDIEKLESMSKSKKKRLMKKNKLINTNEQTADFEVNVQDPRFSAIFTSHHFNIDPTDPNYRKTKGTEALINEKLKRRNDTPIENKTTNKKHRKEDKVTSIEPELAALVKSVKRKTENLKKIKPKN